MINKVEIIIKYLNHALLSSWEVYSCITITDFYIRTSVEDSKESVMYGYKKLNLK